jgi:hypothetical protein
VVTAASSKADVVAALRSANAHQVQTAASIMADQCEQGVKAVRQVFAAAGAVTALVAAMATHGAHPGAQEQLCRAIGQQAALSGDNRVRQHLQIPEVWCCSCHLIVFSCSVFF